MMTRKIVTTLALPCLLLAGCDGGQMGGDAGPETDASTTPECSSGTTLCGGECVVTDVDRDHCGACDNACDVGQACVGGACEVVCPEGQEECDGACADVTSDRRNCGSCGNACGDGEICTDGACELSCSADQMECDGACVSVDSDPLNCGACGNACDAGQVCSEGTCAVSCSAGLTDCGGACVDTQTNPDHCDGCGNVCPAGAGADGVCVAGSCRAVCEDLRADCNGDLAASDGDGCETDLGADPENCGVCTNTCSLDSAVAGCAAGSCAIASCDAGYGDCDGLVDNGCELNVSDDELNCGACGTVCSSGQSCIDGTCMTVEGEDCGSAIALSDGANSVAWNAFVVDYLTSTPSCTPSSYDIDGPDVVLSYTATTTGTHTFTLNPPSSTRWTMALSTEACGTVTPEAGCSSEYGNPMEASPYLMAGETVYLYVADTDSGSSALDNPLPVDVTAPSCGTPTAPTVTNVDPADGTTTSTLTPTFEVAFDAPVYESAGTITIMGDSGTSLTYDLSTSPTEVSFDSTRTVMTIDPGITFPSAEALTIDWTGIVGRACGTPVAAPTWTVDTVCMAAFCATCTDGVANGDETDVDCGGTSTCPRCSDGALCPNGPSDCVSDYCELGTCGCQAGFEDCDGDLMNGCEAEISSDPANCGGCGTVCGASEGCYSGMCLMQGTGEDCSSPWILLDGVNSVSWTASSADYLTSTPSCVSVGSVEGPDLVLTYTATTTGTHDLEFDKPTSTRWVAIVSTGACGTLTPELACISDWSPSTMGGSFSLTAGETAYIYVRDTSSGTNPLDNPMTVTLTPPTP